MKKVCIAAVISLMVLSGCNNSKSSNENGNLEEKALKTLAADSLETYVAGNSESNENEETIEETI
ncbi:MAG TPA: hypothetical protein DCE02_04985, partial [Ruminiclostridium sp.]|nr:hypothetical protein [Ruminiclostridium sp.]